MILVILYYTNLKITKMRIGERERGHWDEKTRTYKSDKPWTINTDGPEILKWMRSLSKIQSVGIKELPAAIKPESSYALGRFMDMETLKNGWGVLVYVVRDCGLYRQWVYIDSPKFTNDGHASTLSAMSEGAILKSIMKYKDGKRVGQDGLDALKQFSIDYFEAAKNGTSGSYDTLKGYLQNDLNIQLPNKWTLNDLRDAFEGAVANGRIDERDLYNNTGNGYHRITVNYEIH